MSASPLAPRNERAPMERLRLSPRSAVVLVVMIGLTTAFVRLVISSQRVLGWILTAAVVAALLHPFVAACERRMRRGLAVGLVVLLTAGSGGLIVYGAVDGLVHEMRKLERAVPRRAAEIEDSPRFGKAAREFKLVERSRRFVKEVPNRLRGGTPQEALRSAATRGVAFLATGVLSLFFLLHGPRLAKGAAEQINDDKRRKRVERLALATYRRGFGYARGSLAMAVVAGLVAYLLARAASVPGPAPLALWVGIWDLVPILGAFIGAVPIVILAGVTSLANAVLLGVAFVTYQAVEQLFLQRRLERRTIKLGPFLTVAGGFAGIELYGIGGALMVLMVASLGAALADEWTGRA